MEYGKTEKPGDSPATTAGHGHGMGESAAEVAVARLLRADFSRLGIERENLKSALLKKDWLVGYVAGACIARAETADSMGTDRLVGFMARVCGELMGGGKPHRAVAFRRLRQSMGSREFMLGSADGRRSWNRGWLR